MEPIISHTKNQEISIAPMLGITTPHFRYFMRMLTKKAILYTEMVPSKDLFYRKYFYMKLIL